MTLDMRALKSTKRKRKTRATTLQTRDIPCSVLSFYDKINTCLQRYLRMKNTMSFANSLSITKILRELQKQGPWNCYPELLQLLMHRHQLDQKNCRVALLKCRNCSMHLPYNLKPKKDSSSSKSHRNNTKNW